MPSCPKKFTTPTRASIPGQFAGLLGSRHEPWFIEATDKPHAYHSYSGAFPQYLFDLHKGEPSDKLNWRFEVPNLTLPEGVLDPRHRERMDLLGQSKASSGSSKRPPPSPTTIASASRPCRCSPAPQVRHAFDVRSADPRILDRYGDNSFGWSLLMARRLVEAGVNMVQVNMGNFGSWDLHGNNFPCLKNYLFPPTDRAVSALLDDLHESGLLDSTLVVMAGEFGRTPRITHIARNIYKTPGRDHWGPLQTALFAGGGVHGGAVIGASDANGAYPVSDAADARELRRHDLPRAGHPPQCGVARHDGPALSRVHGRADSGVERVVNDRFSQDDREHGQTPELEDAFMSDERPENRREERLAPSPSAHSFSPRPTSHVLEKLPFCTGCGLFSGCICSCIALQYPQGPLNACRDTLAFLVDRHTLRGQSLPVF